MSSAKAEPESAPDEAAQTSENLRSHLMDRSSHAPAAVTASGIKRERSTLITLSKRSAYFLTCLSNATSAATAGEPALRDARVRAAVKGFTAVTSRRVRPSRR